MQLSTFLPQTVKLVPADEIAEWPELADVTLLLKPPTWGADNLRTQAINSGELKTQIDLMVEEAWLTFGATNLTAQVPAQVNGDYVITKVDGAYVVETTEVKFTPGMAKADFKAAFLALPGPIADFWYTRVCEVAPSWAYRFQAGVTE